MLVREPDLVIGVAEIRRIRDVELRCSDDRLCGEDT
jgi:hypothetical protein